MFLEKNFVEINDMVSWESRLGKTLGWKHKADLYFRNISANIFSVMRFHVYLLSWSLEKETGTEHYYFRYRYLLYIYIYILPPCFLSICSFNNSWVLPYIVNPIKCYISFAPVWISVWWLLQKCFFTSQRAQGIFLTKHQTAECLHIWRFLTHELCELHLL